MDAEDLAAARLVGHADDDLAVEAAGAAERLVDRFGPVGRGDDDGVLPRLDAVEQGQQLGDEALLGLAGDLAALGRDRIDLVDEDDRRRALRRLLENLAQPPLALAIGRAHDLGPGDVEELGGAFVGDGAREQGLAGAGRAVEQHALGRIDAEPLEQLGMAQRKLDHLAQRVDRVAHAAEIVIGDVGAALRRRVAGIFGQQLDRGLAVDVDDALGRGRDDDQPQFLKRESGRVEHLPDVVGHVGVDALVAGGRDRVAFDQRPPGEGALQRVGRALEPDVRLGRARRRRGSRASTRPCGPRRNRPSRPRHWRAAGRRGG